MFDDEFTDLDQGPAITDFHIESSPFELTWEDSSLHEKFDSQSTLEEEIFYESKEKAPAPVDHEFLEAALTASSGLALSK